MTSYVNNRRQNHIKNYKDINPANFLAFSYGKITIFITFTDLNLKEISNLVASTSTPWLVWRVLTHLEIESMHLMNGSPTSNMGTDMHNSNSNWFPPASWFVSPIIIRRKISMTIAESQRKVTTATVTAATAATTRKKRKNENKIEKWHFLQTFSISY